MNSKTAFNDGWEFAKSGLDATDSEGLAFTPVDIPHDWLIWNTQDLYENGIGWYRKHFNRSSGNAQVLLYFDGVYMDSTVFVNGLAVGEWKYGYSSFEHDITDAVVKGKNEVLVKVVFQSPNSRWYSGAGIYRNVWIKQRGKTYIATDGVYVTSKRQGSTWQVEVDTELKADEIVEVSHTIQRDGRTVAESRSTLAASEAMQTDRQALTLVDPLLWSPDDPNLYRLVTRLQPISVDLPVETFAQNLGFREIALDPQDGLKLNSQKLKLNGVCEHHDLGALGAAFNLAARRRRFTGLTMPGSSRSGPAGTWPAGSGGTATIRACFYGASAMRSMTRTRTSVDRRRPACWPASCAPMIRKGTRRSRSDPTTCRGRMRRNVRISSR